MQSNWLGWARRLAAIAQSGLTYARDPYDVERYEEVRGIAADMMSNGSTQETDTWVELLSREQGYATPKVDVRGVVIRAEHILLVRERADEDRWTLPGGWADVESSPKENVEREVWEESGFEVRATRLLAVYDRSKHPHMPPYPFHIYKLFFLCEITGGGAASGLETSEVGFFPEHALPTLSHSRVVPAQIARMFELYRHPEWPADFD